jgi:hypothetical protein
MVCWCHILSHLARGEPAKIQVRSNPALFMAATANPPRLITKSPSTQYHMISPHLPVRKRKSAGYGFEFVLCTTGAVFISARDMMNPGTAAVQFDLFGSHIFKFS